MFCFPLGTPSSTAPYLKQGTNLVLLQVSLDPGLLIRRHGERAGAGAECGQNAPLPGAHPPSPWTGAGSGAELARLGSPSLEGLCLGRGRGLQPPEWQAWGFESRKPCTAQRRQLRQLGDEGGTHSLRSPTAPAPTALPPRSTGSGAGAGELEPRGLAPLGGSSRDLGLGG